MAERTVLVCDVCGAPSSTTVSFKANGASYQKDLCATHVADLVKGARPPKRGRRRKVEARAPAVTGPRRVGRPPKIGAARSAPTSRRASASKSTEVKDSHDRSALASQKSPAVKRPRKKITDPAILKKRRDALAKARKALAERRAAATKA